MIEHQELDIAQIEEEMTKPEVYQDHEKSLELTETVNKLKYEIEQLIEEWTALQEENS